MAVEWALHPADAGDLADLLAGGSVRAVPGGLACDLPAPLPGRVTFTRLYWGDGFCHFLLPTRAERRLADDASSAHDLALTLATPPLADPELDALREVLAWCRPGEEVEINDWGALRLLRREFPHLRPILGRTLLKSLKDPRRAGGDREPAVTRAIAAILAEFGVGMVSADVLAAPGDLGLAVSFPYQFVSAGRVCLIGATSLETARKFSLAAPCRRECRDFMLDLATPEWHLVQKGNTVYAPWTPAQVEAFAAALDRGQVARAVYASGVDRDRRFLRGAFGTARPAMIPLAVL